MFSSFKKYNSNVYSTWNFSRMNRAVGSPDNRRIDFRGEFSLPYLKNILRMMF